MVHAKFYGKHWDLPKFYCLIFPSFSLEFFIAFIFKQYRIAFELLAFGWVALLTRFNTKRDSEATISYRSSTRYKRKN